MAAMVAQKDTKIIALKAASVKECEEGIDSIGKLSAENTDLHAKVQKFAKKVEVLTRKNEDLTQQLLKTHAAGSERMTMLLK